MTTYSTGNPVGSPDPRDLYDNAENLDNAANSDDATWTDRLGDQRKTWRGMENEFDADQSARASEFEADQDSREAQFVQLMTSGGYTGTGGDGAVEDYASGITVSAYKEIIRDNGEFWRPSADTALPYTTTGAGMPENGAFVNVGDGVLRQDLVQPVATFNRVSDMVNASNLDVGRKARTLGYYEPGDGGGNDYEIVVSGTGTDDGGSFIDLAGSGLQAKGLFNGGAKILQFGVSDGEEFVVYVATDGDNLNSGFSSASPKATLQAANDALLGFRQPIQGKVAIEMAAGTYTDRANITALTVDQLVVRGPDVGGHPNVPSAIIDLDGQTVETAIRGRPFTKVYLKDIKAVNVRGTSNSQGAFTCAESSNMDFENTHVDGCNGSGIYVSNLSRGIVYSGIYEDCNYGIEFYGESQGSIGRGAQSNSDAPLVIGASGNGAGIAIRRNSHAKIARAVVNGNNVSGYRGVFVNDSCTTHMTDGLIERCDTAIFAFPNSYALVGSAVNLMRNDATRFNSQLFFAGPGSTIDYDGTDTTRSTEKLNKFSADEVSHTGTTTTTDLVDVAELLARDFYSGRAYRVELSGNISGTGATKSIRLRIAGGGVGNFVILPFDASSTGRYRASFDIIAVDGTITALASGVVEGFGAVVARSSKAFTWDADATLSVAVTLGDASDSVTIDYYRSFVTGQ